MKTLLPLALFTWLLATAPPLHAKDRKGEAARAVSLNRSLQSPYCPGRTLWDCPSERAGKLRADIRHWVAEGASNEEIRARLEAKVPGFDFTGGTGDEISTCFPLVIVCSALVILTLLWFRFRPRRHAAINPSATKTEPNEASHHEELDDLLEQELSKLEKL